MNSETWKTQTRWSANSSRQIAARIVIEGDLELLTPAHFGSGDADDLTDMPLLVDSQDNKTPLLPGASIAGALRSYLTTREMGYRQSPQKQQEWNSVARQLFGGFGETIQQGEKAQLSEQSALIIDDSLAKPGTFGIERRHGVKLSQATRTAEDDKLFDMQLWQAGTSFPLRFELAIREVDDAALLKRGLATALTGLADGTITLGSRKRRGYGQVQVAGWRVKVYELSNSAELCEWLDHGNTPLSTPPDDLYQALNIEQWDVDNRQQFCLTATFALDGSLLIRSGGGKDDTGPDMVHLHNGKKQPILSGTSLTGALRARAFKIVNTLGGSIKAQTVVDGLFGPELTNDNKKKAPVASKIAISETVIQNPVRDLVQNRVSIDRFTGGARDTALFNEQPVWGKPETCITIDLRLINPTVCEIGLLLLLLKDLWTGDLPLGGESSVGRGRLKGKEATLTLEEMVWGIKEENGRLQFSGNGKQADLQEKYLQAFLQEVGHAQ